MPKSFEEQLQSLKDLFKSWQEDKANFDQGVALQGMMLFTHIQYCERNNIKSK